MLRKPTNPVAPAKGNQWETQPQTGPALSRPTMAQAVTSLALFVQLDRTPCTSGRIASYTTPDGIFALPDPQFPLPSGLSLILDALISPGGAHYGMIQSPIPLSSHGFMVLVELSVLPIDPESAFSFLGDCEPSKKLMSPPPRDTLQTGDLDQSGTSFHLSTCLGTDGTPWHGEPPQPTFDPSNGPYWGLWDIYHHTAVTT